jgi:nucleoside-diphosphate-sugar epimerase
LALPEGGGDGTTAGDQLHRQQHGWSRENRMGKDGARGNGNRTEGGTQGDIGPSDGMEGHGTAMTSDTGVLMEAAAVNLPPAAAAGIGRMVVFGGGYSGRRCADALARSGVAVTVTHRLAPQPTEAAAGPLPWLAFDPARGLRPNADALRGVTHLLVTIPPDSEGRDPVLTHLGSLLAELPLHWVGYLSTTGVYGDTGGTWVDESSAPAPGLGRSRARLACEQAWRDRNLPLQVFRLPAIYGPGRTPFASLRDGTARIVHKSGQVFCRIHVDDIVGAVLHNLALPESRRPDTLIVADTAPCPSSETLGFAAHLLGLPLPPVQRYERIADSLSPMARSFWSENRRVSSHLLREQLGYRLRYPTYREGFRASLAEEMGAASPF